MLCIRKAELALAEVAADHARKDEALWKLADQELQAMKMGTEAAVGAEELATASFQAAESRRVKALTSLTVANFCTEELLLAKEACKEEAEMCAKAADRAREEGQGGLEARASLEAELSRAQVGSLWFDLTRNDYQSFIYHLTGFVLQYIRGSCLSSRNCPQHWYWMLKLLKMRLRISCAASPRFYSQT